MVAKLGCHRTRDERRIVASFIERDFKVGGSILAVACVASPVTAASN
ncbi:hypothetical protein J2X11_001697 [Aeromicrobium panaciterrae]|uniref:Transposase n=1 Tax=Aeromicrobium panaciterrae TaxID=363861 RepID=A0ABU1UNU8_9ACTN|nr:hypothetical protein [Aeromicrobium panaciterrae]